MRCDREPKDGEATGETVHDWTLTPDTCTLVSRRLQTTACKAPAFNPSKGACRKLGSRIKARAAVSPVIQIAPTN